MKYEICAIIKDELRYLEEWIKHNIDLGFTDIYLFEDYDSVPHNFITDKYPQVHITRCEDYFPRRRDYDNGSRRQERLFRRFLKEHKGEGWCAFIDPDEYIFFNDGYDLKKLCNEFSDVNGVALPWRMKGASGHIRRPEGSIVDNYTEDCEFLYTDRGYCLKSLVNLNLAVTFDTLHVVRGLNTADRKLVIGTRYKPDCLYHKVQLNHYFTKSFEDWVERCNKRQLCANHRHFADFVEANSDMSFMLQDFIDFDNRNKSYEELEEIWKNRKTKDDLKPFLENRRVIATMTSNKERINEISYVIDRLLSQSIKPDFAYLNLSTEEFPEHDIPESLNRYGEFLKINWVKKDTHSMKKIYPILPLVNDSDILITIDEDCPMPDNFIEGRLMDFMQSNELPVGGWRLTKQLGFCGSGNVFKKEMLKGYDKFIDETLINTDDDESSYTSLLVANGYKQVPCSINPANILKYLDNINAEKDSCRFIGYFLWKLEQLSQQSFYDMIKNNITIDWNSVKEQHDFFS